jgi:hypothetical protein
MKILIFRGLVGPVVAVGVGVGGQGGEQRPGHPEDRGVEVDRERALDDRAPAPEADALEDGPQAGGLPAGGPRLPGDQPRAESSKVPSPAARAGQTKSGHRAGRVTDV